MAKRIHGDQPVRWNADMVQSLVFEQEKRIIQSIPLSWNRADDWRYYGEAEMEHSQLNISITVFNSRRWRNLSIVSYNPWSKIWGLDIPNKVKHFLFRFMNNMLPCRRNLAKRGGSGAGLVCAMCYVGQRLGEG